MQVGCLLHDIFAGEIIAALLEHLDQRLRGGVGIDALAMRRNALLLDQLRENAPARNRE